MRAIYTTTLISALVACSSGEPATRMDGGSGLGGSGQAANGGSVVSGVAGDTGAGGSGTTGAGDCKVASIAAGGEYACAVLTTGSLRCWGLNDNGQLGTGRAMALSPPDGRNVLTGVMGVGAGSANTCAVTTSGGVRCWGQYRLGTNGFASTTMKDLLSPPTTDILTGAKAIAVGADHACAVMATGALMCWGFNASGQIGDGTFTTRMTPVEVLQNVQAVAVGAEHTCALTTTGGVRCWGADNYRQLGREPGPMSIQGDDPVPPDTDAITDIQSVSAGDHHTCAVTNSGGVRCWGSNEAGQLGVPGLSHLTPPTVDTLTGVKAVAAGRAFTCALMTTGAVRCWGDNGAGQLGDGTTTARATIGGDILSGAQAIAAGVFHACAVMATGSVRCWGYNHDGELGIGFATPMSAVPTADLQGLDGVCP